jgi:hypothetical protein
VPHPHVLEPGHALMRSYGPARPSTPFLLLEPRLLPSPNKLANRSRGGRARAQLPPMRRSRAAVLTGLFTRSNGGTVRRSPRNDGSGTGVTQAEPGRARGRSIDRSVMSFQPSEAYCTPSGIKKSSRERHRF